LASAERSIFSVEEQELINTNKPIKRYGAIFFTVRKDMDLLVHRIVFNIFSKLKDEFLYFYTLLKKTKALSKAKIYHF
jgi:hypothetical protein